MLPSGVGGGVVGVSGVGGGGGSGGGVVVAGSCNR